MDRPLNVNALTEAAAKKGLNQARIASHLAVSREAVSKWFSGRAFPRPDKLLRLGMLLELPYEALTESAASVAEPVVAFRKRAARKITDEHIAHAKGMGAALSALVPHLPFDELILPPKLKLPRVDYAYLQEAVKQVRERLGVPMTAPLNFEQLVGTFKDMQAVLIPVMWGQKTGHENALHIFLPESSTTWIYLNLDSHLFDFKFWMAHEMGHVYSPDLRGEEAEDFADAFAGSLLFPKALAEEAYKRVSAVSAKRDQIRFLQGYAQKYLISPISVYKEINKYARHIGQVELDLEPVIYSSTQVLNSRNKLISELLFDSKEPTPARFISTVSKVFKTPFFNTLKEYLSESKRPVGFVQAVLDIPFLDAKGICSELG